MSKRYKCPYCTYKGEREDLIEHIGDEHEEMIPEEYTPRRIVYNQVNKIDSGVCMVCKSKTEWDEKAGRYKKLCGKESCKRAVRSTFEKRMIKVYNTTCLLDDPDHQEKMLANRRISGEYTFSSEPKLKKTYTGQNERKLLEFEDKVLGIKATDIEMPGPKLQYKYNGETHTWITDQYLIPWNLVIEVKDGGNNPNKRPMQSYRDKQVAKELMITELGTFNYLRLTDNQFDQLMAILAELKMEMIDDTDDNRKAVIRINESAANAAANAIPTNGCYIVSYGYMNNGFDGIEGFAVTPDILSNKIYITSGGRIKTESWDFMNNRKFSIYKYTGSKSINDLLTEKEVPDNYFYKELTESGLITKDFLDFSPHIKPVFLETVQDITQAITSTILHQFREVTGENDMYFPIRKANIDAVKKDVIGDDSNLDVLQDVDGYFVLNKNLNQRSKSYAAIKDIPKSVATTIGGTDIKEVMINV